MDHSSFSWERACQVSGQPSLPTDELVFGSRAGTSIEDLLVFGYSCKLYRDDDKSQWINSGRHLIPWMGDANLMIDRYDARGYLNDLSDCSSSKSFLNNQEQEFENRLNLERFADLKSTEDDVTEKHASRNLDSKREYASVKYNYDDDMTQSPSVLATKEDSGEDETFRCPSSLKVPPEITMPKSQKLHCIIEKTAMFVADQGQQMEILLKTKQASNSNFSFLSIESELYPYYKFLLNEIKSKKYIPSDSIEKEDSDMNDDSDSDGDYLHPSLLASKKVPNKSENMNLTDVFASKQDNSYSQLVKQFKDKFAEDEEKTNCNSSEELPKTPKCDHSPLIPKPPANVELIITKMAQHVAKKGDSFENQIKSLGNPKFDFLTNGHLYHPYYVQQKIRYVSEHKKETSKINSLKPIVFSLNANKHDKSKKDKTSSNESVKMDFQEDSRSAIQEASRGNFSQDSNEKKLQEKRKKKVLEFVKLLKKQKSLHSPVQTYGPNLPSEDPELSPTIEAVTSPVHFTLDDADLELDLLGKNSYEERGDSCKPNDDLPGGLVDALPANSQSPPVRQRPVRYSPPRRYRSGSEESNSPRRVSPRRKRSRRSSRSRSRSRSSYKSHRSRHKEHKSSRHRRHSHSSRSRSSSRSPSHSRSRHRSKR